MSKETSTGEMFAVRTRDGAWYELPASLVEQERIRDAETLTEVRHVIEAGGGNAPDFSADDSPPVVQVSPEVLAPYRVDDERAAALAAALTADTDTSGFADLGGTGLTWSGTHNAVYGTLCEKVPGDTAGSYGITCTPMYYIPLNLFQQIAPRIQPLGYGR